VCWIRCYLGHRWLAQACPAHSGLCMIHQLHLDLCPTGTPSPKKRNRFIFQPSLAVPVPATQPAFEFSPNLFHKSFTTGRLPSLKRLPYLFPRLLLLTLLSTLSLSARLLCLLGGSRVFLSVSQVIEVMQIILISAKYSLSIMSPLDNVARVSSDYNSRDPRHYNPLS